MNEDCDSSSSCRSKNTRSPREIDLGVRSQTLQITDLIYWEDTPRLLLLWWKYTVTVSFSNAFSWEWELLCRYGSTKEDISCSILVLLNEWETLIWPQWIGLGGKTYLMNGCCQTKQRLKPPLFWKLPILLLLTQLNFLKFIHPREESCGTRPPAWRDVGSLTNTTHGPDLRQQPGYFCIFTQCQRGFFTSNIIGRLCLRQNWKAGGWKKILALYEWEN